MKIVNGEKVYFSSPAKRAYNKKVYYTRKEAGLCTNCGKPVEDGYSMCLACREHRRGYQNHNNYYTRERRKKLGLCIICGKNPARERKTMCVYCSNRYAERSLEYYYRKRHENGQEVSKGRD